MSRRRTLALAASLLLAGSASAQSGPGCADRPTCAEVTSFVATVGDFRVSTQGRTRLLTFTVRFRNKTDHVLRLAYVRGSAVAIDDQGNRYVVTGPQSVRAIGEITDNAFDPKFALAPGETSDARFELAWAPERGGQLFGTRFEGDVTVREIDPAAAAGQYRAGREHALHFRALGGDAVVASAPAYPAPNAAPAPVAPQGDLCEARPRCNSAGLFTTEVTNVIPSVVGRHRTMRMELKVTNRSSQPLVLGYKHASGSITDDLGNRYYWGRPGTHDMSAQGIGTVTGGQADPQFSLAPGQSRRASFELIRYDAARQPLGSAFNYDLALVQLEMLPGNQIRAGREYAVSFPGLTAGGAPNAAQAIDAGKALLGGCGGGRSRRNSIVVPAAEPGPRFHLERSYERSVAVLRAVPARGPGRRKRAIRRPGPRAGTAPIPISARAIVR